MSALQKTYGTEENLTYLTRLNESKNTHTHIKMSKKIRAEQIIS